MTALKIMDALTMKEAEELIRLETVIADGVDPLRTIAAELLKLPERDLTQCVEVLRALEAIRDGRLYRTVSAGFEDYCREKWGLAYSKRHINRLIEILPVIEAVGHARPKITVRQACDVLAEAKAEAKEDPAQTPQAKRLADILKRRQEEIERDEAAARQRRASMQHPERDRLKAIRGKIVGALKLVSGDIDVAEELCEVLLKAKEIVEGASILQAEEPAEVRRAA